MRYRWLETVFGYLEIDGDFFGTFLGIPLSCLLYLLCALDIELLELSISHMIKYAWMQSSEAFVLFSRFWFTDFNWIYHEYESYHNSFELISRFFSSQALKLPGR